MNIFIEKIKNLKQNQKNLIYLFIYLFIPLFFQAIFPHFNGIFIKEKSGWGIKVFLIPTIQALGIIFPLFIFPKIIKYYIIFITIFIYIPYYISLSHIIIFKTLIDKNVLMAIFDTNLSETTGFIKQYLNFSVILLLLFFIFMFIFVFKNLKYFKLNKNFLLWQKISFIMLLISILSLKSFSNTTRRHQLIPINMYYLYKSFENELLANKIKEKRKEIKPFKNIIDKFQNKKTTFVVIIGESASRSHYQIYGYNRPTNPLLSKRNDIYLFSNVETSHAQTLPALQKVLSFAYEDNLNLIFSKGSIINYFKDAGFKTFWISNQEYGGRFASYQTIVGDEADFKIFNNSLKKEKNKDLIYDLELMNYFKQALNDKTDKKVIFLHLRGSHAPYNTNYPSEFNIFKEKNSYKEQQINAYDNSIIYNDFVINSFIDELSKKKEISYLLYLSDHGEDVGDSKNSCFCHHDKKRTPSMMNIPFIIWLSPEYKKENYIGNDVLIKNLKTKYNTENVIHSIIKLSGLSNPDYDKKKSIF